MHWIYSFLGFFFAVYFLTGVIFVVAQRRLIFRSRALAPDYAYSFGIPFQEINLKVNEKDNLNLVQFPSIPGETPKGLVLYFHGNRENISRYARFAVDFTRHHYEVWMVDYPGYGKSTGRQTEDNFYFQAGEAYRLANEKFPAESIILYGKSLGSGIASYLACSVKCRRLVLETPYYSMGDLMAYFAPLYPARSMTRFKFPVGENCRRVVAPITLFAGKKDRVIPISCSEKLRPMLKSKDEFIVLEEGTHHNLSQLPEYQENLKRILD